MLALALTVLKDASEIDRRYTAAVPDWATIESDLLGRAAVVAHVLDELAHRPEAEPPAIAGE